MQFVVVLVVLYVLYQYWKKRQGEPRVKKSRGTVIDIDVDENGDMENAPLPYQKQPYLQNRSERLLFEGLKRQLQPLGVEVFPQVDVLGLLYVPRTAKNFAAFYNRLAGKRVSFVLCDGQTFQPLAAIRLDTIHLENKDGYEENLFLDRAFETAKLPLIHFMASEENYLWDEVMETLRPYIRR